MRARMARRFNEGDVITTKRCGECRIVSYPYGATKLRVRFLREPQYEIETDLKSIHDGTIKDPWYPTVAGVGFIGAGVFVPTEVIDRRRRNTKEYSLWSSMLARCYNADGPFATYRDCTVVTRWHNFQLFARDVQRMPNWDAPGFDMDKDLRVLGNREYGPKTVSFIPAHVNTAVIRTEAVGRSSPKHGKYPVMLCMNGKTVCLGTFATNKEATTAYKLARARHFIDLAARYRDCVLPAVRRNLLILARNLQIEARELQDGQNVHSQDAGSGSSVKGTPRRRKCGLP